MSGSFSTSELADLLVQRTGMRKKLAVQILQAIPDIVEEGLKKDGEARVKGMGTFRLVWIQDRTGRNPKTGQKVLIPAHYKLAFLPEQSFKDYINRDNKLLSYELIPAESDSKPEEKTGRRAEEFSTAFPEPEEEKTAQPLTGEETEPVPAAVEPEPEVTPKRRRRIHWIIPTVIIVIAVLSVIFYFRNFNPVVSRKSLVVSQQSAAEQSDVLSEAKVPGDQHVLNPPLADEGSSVSSPVTTDSINHSTFNFQPSTFITSVEGKHLFQLAREVYGNPFLWVLIYRANTEKIPDPDMLISGLELAIPALEGQPDHLSRNDSLKVAAGYRLVYDFYEVNGDPKADDFHRAYLRYRP